MTRFWRAVFHLGLRLGWMTLAAEALVQLTTVEAPGRPIRVLCLSKAVFTLDLAAVAQASSRLTFLHFPRLLLSDIVRRHVDDFDALSDASYYPLLEGTEAQGRIRADMAVVVRHLCRRLSVDAVFAGNFVYVSQQEFFYEARQQGIPIAVLYKEGMIPLGRYAYAGSQLYGTKKCLAHCLLFYNVHVRQMLLDARVPGVTAEASHVVGVPRMDACFAPATPSAMAGPRHLVLFGFDPEEKARYLIGDREVHSAFKTRLEDFQVAWVRYATAHPDVRLTIKLKSGPVAQRRVRELLERYGVSTLPSNVVLTASGEPLAMIRSAAAVAGYASTTLLEALACGVPVVTPELRDVLTDGPADYFDAAPDAVLRVRGVGDLQAALDGDAALPIPTEAQRRAILEPLVFAIDGRASQRVEEQLVSLATSSRSWGRT